jgi:hypothetical protein
MPTATAVPISASTTTTPPTTPAISATSPDSAATCSVLSVFTVANVVGAIVEVSVDGLVPDALVDAVDVAGVGVVETGTTANRKVAPHTRPALVVLAADASEPLPPLTDAVKPTASLSLATTESGALTVLMYRSLAKPTDKMQ